MSHNDMSHTFGLVSDASVAAVEWSKNDESVGAGVAIVGGDAVG